MSRTNMDACIRDLNFAVAGGVVRVDLPTPSGKYDWCGTGFLFENAGLTFLVTCRHVLDANEPTESANLKVRLRTSLGYPSSGRELFLPLWDGTRRLYRVVPDPGPDLAAIQIPREVLPAEGTMAFSESDLAPDDLYLPIGSEVVLPGFPQGYHDHRNNLPIVRRASVASLYRVPFEGNPYFQVDGNLQRGMSGAPVFVRPESFVYRYSQPCKFMGGPVSYLLGVHSEGVDRLGIHVVWYADEVVRLTAPAWAGSR